MKSERHRQIRLRQIRHVALDLDGTIYTDDLVFPEALTFLKRIKSAGIGRTFVTNNSSKSRQDYVDKLQRLGIDATADEVYTSAHATIEYLHHHHPAFRSLMIVGTASLAEEFKSHGFTVVSEQDCERPDAIIVGYDPDLKFSQLCKACHWIAHQVPFLATHPDKVCPTDADAVMLDCGSICAAIQAGTGQKPIAVPGKPSPAMLSGILSAHQLGKENLAMIGDRVYTDMAMAKAADVLSVLVLTGEATKLDAEQSPDAFDFVVNHIGEFGDLLLESRSSSQ